MTQENEVEHEPTAEELELAAAKQLLLELKMIKQRIYDSKTLINGMLIVQVKMLLAGLMTKYREAGLLVGENITLKLSDRGKHASIFFEYTPRLKLLMALITAQLTQQQVETFPK